MELTELERRLRATLDDEAGRITPRPAPPDLEQQVGRRQARQRRRATAVTAAAAAAVVAVVTITSGIGLPSGGQHRGQGVAHDPDRSGSGTAELIPAAPIPGRRDAGAVWDGTEYVVWGGYRSGTPRRGLDQYRSDGAAYDPATRRWRVLPRAPITARSRPIMYWTGHEVVVWGGEGDHRGEIPDGAAYDPSTGRWRTLPTVRPVGDGLDSWAAAGSHLFVARSGQTNPATHREEYENSTVMHFDATTNRWSWFRAAGRVADLKPCRDGVLLLERTSGRFQVAYVSRDGVRRAVVALPGSLAEDGVPHGDDVPPGLRHLVASGDDVTVSLTAESAPIPDGTPQGRRQLSLKLWHLQVNGAADRLALRDGPVTPALAEGTGPLVIGGRIYPMPDHPARLVLLTQDMLSIFDTATGQVVRRFAPPSAGWPRSGCDLLNAAYATSGDTVLMWSGVECVMDDPTAAGLLWRVMG